MACLMLILALAASASQAQALLRHNGAAEGFVRALEFKHQLRVCNAYPASVPLDVFNADGKLTDKAMSYKSCQDFPAPLKVGDKLDFKNGDATLGTFAVSDLPTNDAVLLLIIHRHDQASTAVSFESHVFSNMKNAQVAVIDTYKGSVKSTPVIKTRMGKENKLQSEELRFSSIVSVSPGDYEVELRGEDDKVTAKQEFVALSRESYVILRTGLEAKSGPSFPQELVVYPNSDLANLKSGAAAPAAFVALAAALVGVLA